MENIESIESLTKLLQAVHQTHDERLGQEFNRSLSFQDGLFDRWERAKRLKFGENASIYNSALVFGKVEVGRNTWVGPYTLLDGTGGLKIGDYCSISAGVHIYTHDTVLWALSGGKQASNIQAVTIGNCCHIGAQSIIKAGVAIGAHCVIGANTFVNTSVPANKIVVGNPGKIIGEVVFEGDQIKFNYFSDKSE